MDQVNGPVVGAFHDVSFQEQSVDLSPGDTILLYTDGVTEAQNSKEEFYGDDRLCNFLKKQSFSSPRHMVNSISNDVMNFIGNARQLTI